VKRGLVLWAIAWLLGPASGAWGQEPPAGAQAPAAEQPGEPAPDAEAPLGEDDAMVLNFQGADIREVIHSLAGALGINYQIDPRVEGNITIRTTGKVAREDLFPLFNQILRNNGIAAVRVGDMYQILPIAEAKTRAIVPRNPAVRSALRDEDAFEIEIISLQHLGADEMVGILQPFVTPGGDVLSYPRANVVVVTDIASNVQRLRDLAATFDVDVFRNQQVRVFKVKDGDPEELANEILGILSPYGVVGTDGGEVFMVPLNRLNSIVVFAIDPATFTEVARWLKMLDIPPEEGAGRQTFVYNVENAKALDLADVLNELFGGGPGGGPGGAGRAPGAPPAGVGLFGAGGVAGGRGGVGGAGGAGGAGGGRLGGGGGGRRAGGAGGAGQAGTAFGQQVGQQAGAAAGQPGGGLGGAGGAGGTALGRGRGGRAGGGGIGGAAGAAGGAAGGGVARGVSLPGGTQGAGGPGGAEGPPPIFKEEVRIVADEVTNSLVVLATKRDYNLILDVLKRIDVVPRQVVLEVTIAEVALNKDLQFGIRYALSNGVLNSSKAGQTTTSDDGTTTGTGGSIFSPKSSQVAGLIGDALRVPSSGAFAVISDNEHFQIFINALQSRTSVKMLSAPHIIAADNREAHILVGESIPILTSTVSNALTSDVGNTINSVQYRDTGKILTVLPQVNSLGLVNMQIRQEVSAVGAAAFGNTNSPSFSTREAETTVVVQDGDSVLIGGIIDDQVTSSRDGVPFLMDIPVIGAAFRDERNSATRTELLVLITPYVIRNRAEAREVTSAFSENVRGLKVFSRKLQERRAIRRLREPEPTSRPTASPSPATPPAEPAAPVPAEAMP
jgi:general secretion pathway protein D